MGQNKKAWIFSTFAVLAVSIFPVIFLYTYNADEVNFSEAVMPTLLFLATGIVLYIVGVLFTKSSLKGAIISILSMLLLTNFALLEKGVKMFLPSLKYWHTLPIFVFILLHIIYFIHKKITSEMLYNLNKIIFFVFCGLILMNFAMAGPNIVNKVSQEKIAQQKTSFESRKQNSNESKPNIYLLIFDEYASFDMIKKYYNYDNSKLESFLEKKGFTVSNTSCNETILTSIVTTNLVNLDYIVNNTTTEPEIRTQRQNPKLFSLLRDQGYHIQGVGEASQYGLESPVNSVESGSKTIGGETFNDILLLRTVIYPFVHPSSAYAKMITDSIDYVGRKDNIPTEGGQFTLMHVLTPHTPFAFDENGNPTSPEYYEDWKDKQYYLGQYIYTTKLMMQLVGAIVEYDPDSIIILQSDHGARAATKQGLLMGLFQPEDMRGILNAVYYKGEPIPEIEGQSGVNTIRIVLDKLFGIDLGLVEVPEDDYNYKK